MNKTVLASRLVDIASDLSKLAQGPHGKGDECPGCPNGPMGQEGEDGQGDGKKESCPFNAHAALRSVREAQGYMAALMGIKKADSPIKIDKLPGLSPMQLRQQINQVVDARQRATQIRLQFEAILNELKQVEDIDKSGVEKLKEAAKAVKEKEKYLVEAEKGLLTFTAYVQRKRPGVEQMLADPTTVKSGLKAGDFFNRVGAKLGQAVQDAIQVIYNETEEDLTHTADCITSLKIVERTASIRATTLRKAGLSDILITIKDWLAGKGGRLMGFAGDLVRFIRGFTERTGLVKKATKDLTDALDEAMGEIDSALANY